MRIKQIGDYCILCPDRSVSIMQVADKMDETLEYLHNKGHSRICVNLNKSPIIDSSVIGTLVKYHNQLKKEDGELVILSVKNRAVEAMMNLHLGRVIRFIESEAELS